MPALTDEAWTHIRYDYEHTGRTIADICAEHGISDGTLRDRVRRWRWTRRRAPIPREGPPAVAAAAHAFEAPGSWPRGPRLYGDERGEVAANELREQAALPGRSPAEAGGEGGRVGIASPCVATIDPLPIPPLSKGRESVAAGDALTDADPAAIAPRLRSAVARVLPAIESIIARLAAGPLPPREIEQTARALGTLTRTLRELNALLAQHPLRAAVPYDDMPEDLDAFREHLARKIEIFMESRGDEAFEDAPPGTPAGKDGEVDAAGEATSGIR